MKKTYIQPSMIEVKIDNVVLMSGSPDPKFSPNEETNTMGSRFFDYDDDDEDF